MIRTLTTAALLLTLAVPAAQAANFSGVRCDDPSLVAAMEKGLAKATFEGIPLSSYGAHTGSISKSVTTHASRNKLICTISVQLTISGEATPMRMRYTLEQFSGGKMRATLTDI